MGRSTVAEQPSTPDPLVTDPPQPKRRTGRKSKALLEQETLDAEKRQRDCWERDAKALAPVLENVVTIPFGIVASRRGAHWKLKSEETKSIAFALAMIIEKHSPEFITKWQEEIALAIILGGAIGARVNIDRQAEAERKSRKVPVHEQRPSDNGDEANGQDDIASSLASVPTA